MSGSEHDDLIQGEIDGVNSSADSARLKALLASHPDLAIRFEALRGVSEALRQAERFEPPFGLADGVMVAVRRGKPSGREQEGWLQTVRALFAPAPLAACVCTLVLGFTLGALIPPDSLVLSRPEKAALSGMSLPQGRLDRPGKAGRRSFDLAGVHGEAATGVEGGVLVLDLVLDSKLPADVRLEVDATGMSPRAFSQDGPSGGDVVLSSRRVQFTHAGGRCRYSISFNVGVAGGQALRLRVGGDDGAVLTFGQ